MLGVGLVKALVVLGGAEGAGKWGKGRDQRGVTWRDTVDTGSMLIFTSGLAREEMRYKWQGVGWLFELGEFSWSAGLFWLLLVRQLC